MALKLGELVAFLKTDNKQLNQGLNEGKRDFKDAGDDIDRSAAQAAAKVAASWATKLAEVRKSSQGARTKFTSDIDASKAKLIELAAEYDKTGKKSLLKDMSVERAQLRQLTAAVRDLDRVESDAANELRKAQAAAAAETRKVEEAVARLPAGFDRARQSSVGFAASIQASKARIRELLREYDKTGKESLLGDLGKEKSRLRELEGAAAAAAGGGLSSLQTVLGSLGAGTVSVITNVWNLVPVIAALSAVALVATPAVFLLGAAMASLPALAVGGGAAIGALGLGFMGLSDAFRKTAGAGRSVVDTAWQVAQAERRVRDANREVLASQEALSRARETAARRIRDLNSSLAQAHLDERSAVIAVADAEMALAQARNPADAEKAQLALEQAKQTLGDIRTRLGDLTTEQQRNKRTGVEGSDEVKAALDRQRKAVEGVTDAQHALTQAQNPPGGGAGAAGQITKLAASAREFVNVIKGLKPAFESLRLDVQQKLFAGVGGEVKSLAKAWMPQLHQSLGGMATTFNGIFKQFATSAKKPEFIKNIGIGIDSVRGMIDRVGKSISGPFMDAFGRLAKAAGPFLSVLGEELGHVVDSFSKWITSADKSGKLSNFFFDASKYLHEIFSIGKSVFSIFGSFFKILFNNQDLSGGPIVALRMKLDDIAKWMKDPQNQKKIQEWIDKIRDALVWLKDKGIPMAQDFFEKVSAVMAFFDRWGKRAEAFRKGIVIIFNGIVDFFKKLPERISKATSHLWDGIKNSFRSAVNWMIARWNNFQLTIGGGTFLGQTLPSMTLRTPNIPFLANGGNILKAGAAVVGDAGPEILHLPAGAQVQPLSGGGGAASAQPQIIQLRHTTVTPSGEHLREELFEAAIRRGQSPARFLKIA